MKKIILSLIFVLSFSTAIFASQIGDLGFVTEYSAIYIEKDATTTTQTKVYVARNMMRQDLKNGEEIIVTRYDKKEMYIIYPKIRRYILEEYPGQAPVIETKPQEGTFGDMTRKFIDYETINTYRMKKYLVTIKYRGKKENTYQYYEWYQDNFPLPVKTQDLKGVSETEYTKIKLRKPDIELFMKPKSYKQTNIGEINALLLAKEKEEKNTDKKINK
ncbi:MAG: hypothetical protein RR272_01040 [Synergistaceae bacterium]